VTARRRAEQRNWAENESYAQFTVAYTSEKTRKTRLTIRVFLVKKTFLTKDFVFVIVLVLWMGKRGMEKD
jgi:hypothetical protein